MSGYESKAYLALLAHGAQMNGYEVAKASGVPRSTVYESLSKLVVRGAAFELVFGKLFDQLAFEFAVPVDVGDLVDRLEDTPADGRKVSVESDGKACEITLSGFAGSVRVDRQALTIRGRAGTSGGLLDQFLAFVSSVGPLGEPLALPGG